LKEQVAHSQDFQTDKIIPMLKLNQPQLRPIFNELYDVIKGLSNVFKLDFSCHQIQECMGYLIELAGVGPDLKSASLKLKLRFQKITNKSLDIEGIDVNYIFNFWLKKLF